MGGPLASLAAFAGIAVAIVLLLWARRWLFLVWTLVRPAIWPAVVLEADADTTANDIDIDFCNDDPCADVRVLIRDLGETLTAASGDPAPRRFQAAIAVGLVGVRLLYTWTARPAG